MTLAFCCLLFKTAAALFLSSIRGENCAGTVTARNKRTCSVAQTYGLTNCSGIVFTYCARARLPRRTIR